MIKQIQEFYPELLCLSTGLCGAVDIMIRGINLPSVSLVILSGIVWRVYVKLIKGDKYD